jgi:cytoskeletal protein CcmA (bactofilin family)
MMFEKSAPQPQQPLTPAQTPQATAFLGKGAKIVGTISFDGPAQIEGEVEGEITSRDTLTIGRTASLKATIKGTTVVVHGKVTGNVEASSRLEMHAPSRIDGDVVTSKLVVHEGALLNGRCTMDAKADKSATLGLELVPIAQPAAAGSKS